MASTPSPLVDFIIKNAIAGYTEASRAALSVLTEPSLAAIVSFSAAAAASVSSTVPVAPAASATPATPAVPGAQVPVQAAAAAAVSAPASPSTAPADALATWLAAAPAGIGASAVEAIRRDAQGREDCIADLLAAQVGHEQELRSLSTPVLEVLHQSVYGTSTQADTRSSASNVFDYSIRGLPVPDSATATQSAAATGGVAGGAYMRAIAAAKANSSVQ